MEKKSYTEGQELRMAYLNESHIEEADIQFFNDYVRIIDFSQKNEHE